MCHRQRDIECAEEWQNCCNRIPGFGSVIQYPNHPGAIILRLTYEYTAKAINDVLREFLSAVESIMKEAIIIVKIGRYRRRPLNPTK